MHPSTAKLLSHFTYEHLPPHLEAASRPCGELAHKMAELLPGGPEVSAGLRHLLEAKDCFVRANVKPGDHSGTPPASHCLKEHSNGRTYAVPAGMAKDWDPDSATIHGAVKALA